MVRIATVNDAEQLNILNNEFNGEGASIDNIGNSLVSNKQESCKQKSIAEMKKVLQNLRD